MSFIKDIKQPAEREAFNRKEAYQILQKGNKDIVSFQRKISLQNSLTGKVNCPRTNGNENFYLKFIAKKIKT